MINDKSNNNDYQTDVSGTPEVDNEVTTGVDNEVAGGLTDSIMMTNNDGSELTIRGAQAVVDHWIKTIGVRYFSPLTNMAVLTEEVGEVARIMARQYGDQSFKAGEKAELGDELADVLWVLIAIANQTGVDLTEAFRRNLDKKTRRDATRHLSNPKLRD